MRRRVVRVCVLVLIGAGLNVLVAWGLAVYSRAMSWRIVHSPTPEQIRAAGGGAPAGYEIETLVVRRGFGVRMTLVTEMPWMGSTLGMRTDVGTRSWHECASGWPMRSLELDGALSERLGGDSTWALRTWRGGLRAPLGRGGDGVYRWPDALPVRPVALGFAADTLVYAGLVWVVFGAPRGVRSWWRGRGGRCRGCGYALAGLDVCPECGRAGELGARNGPA